MEAVVLTHAHQDHIGALATLLADKAGTALSEVPIYATRYTAAMVRDSCLEHDIRPNLHEVRFECPTIVGPFPVTWFPVTHSAPETAMLIVTTRQGKVVIGTDIKDDPAPLLGKPTDFARLRSLAKGALAFLCDSTNAHRTGRSRSESQVEEGLTALMRDHPDAS